MKHETKSYIPVEVCRTPVAPGEKGEVRECSCGRVWLYDYYRARYSTSKHMGWQEKTNNKRWVRFFKKEKESHYEQE